MKILITGSNGFIGSHIAETLADRGHHVICLVRRTSNCESLDCLTADTSRSTGIEKRIGDVTHPKTLCEAVKGVDAVIHTAGVLRVFDSEYYYHVNRGGTRNLAEALLEYNPKIKKLIYISSQAAMGPSPGLRPKQLGEPENPVSDYGLSKLAGEKELQLLRGRVPYTILRPASVYGPRDKDIFIFFKLVSLGLRPRTLAKRYFQLVFVKDIAEAAIKAIDNPAADYKTYFLAANTPYTWEEAAREIASAAGRKTIPLPVPDFVFKTAAFLAGIVARFKGKQAVLNSQKIT
jgi:nucleoside-diphosphate-sugar epimerase